MRKSVATLLFLGAALITSLASNAQVGYLKFEPQSTNISTEEAYDFSNLHFDQSFGSEVKLLDVQDFTFLDSGNVLLLVKYQEIQQFNLTKPYNVSEIQDASTSSLTKSPNATLALNTDSFASANPTFYKVCVAPDGVHGYLAYTEEESKDNVLGYKKVIKPFTMTVANDLSSASWSSYDFDLADELPNYPGANQTVFNVVDMVINPSSSNELILISGGAEPFNGGTAGDWDWTTGKSVEYTISMAQSWDIESHNDITTLLFDGGNPTDNVFFSAQSMAFNSNGSKSYMLDYARSAIYEYSLSTAYTLEVTSTAGTINTDYCYVGNQTTTNGVYFDVQGSYNQFDYEWNGLSAVELSHDDNLLIRGGFVNTLWDDGELQSSSGLDSSRSFIIEVFAFEQASDLASGIDKIGDGAFQIPSLPVETMYADDYSLTYLNDNNANRTLNLDAYSLRPSAVVTHETSEKMYIAGTFEWRSATSGGGNPTLSRSSGGIFEYTLKSGVSFNDPLPFDQKWEFNSPIDMASNGLTPNLSNNVVVTDIDWSSDGLKVFLTYTRLADRDTWYFGNMHVIECTVTSAFTLDDITFVSEEFIWSSNGSGSSFAASLEFKPDGTEMYQSYYDNSTGEYRIVAVPMSAAWDVSTLDYNNLRTPVTLIDGTVNQTTGFQFLDNGTKFVVGYFPYGASTLDFDVFTLSTAYDLSTMSADADKNTSTSWNSADLHGHFFIDEASSRMYLPAQHNYYGSTQGGVSGFMDLSLGGHGFNLNSAANDKVIEVHLESAYTSFANAGGSLAAGSDFTVTGLPGGVSYTGSVNSNGDILTIVFGDSALIKGESDFKLTMANSAFTNGVAASDIAHATNVSMGFGYHQQEYLPDIIYSDGSWLGGSGTNDQPSMADVGKVAAIRDSVTFNESMMVSVLRIEENVEFILDEGACVNVSDSTTVEASSSLVMNVTANDISQYKGPEVEATVNTTYTNEGWHQFSTLFTDLAWDSIEVSNGGFLRFPDQSGTTNDSCSDCNVWYYNPAVNNGGTDFGSGSYGSWFAVDDSTSVVDPSQGYYIYLDNANYGTAPWTLTMKGKVKSSSINTLSVNENNGGWNMIGNGSSTVVDWEIFFAGNSNLNSTFSVYDPQTEMFKSYGVGAGGTNGGKQYLAPSQGAWVRTSNVGAQNSGDVVHSPQIELAHYVTECSAATNVIYKTEPELIKLAGISSDGTSSDEWILALSGQYSDEYSEREDGAKFFSSRTDVPQLYSGSVIQPIVIDYQNDFNGLEKRIPLFVQYEDGGAGTISLVEASTGISEVYLWDREQNVISSILGNDYQFIHDASFTNRFVLLVNTVETGQGSLGINEIEVLGNDDSYRQLHINNIEGDVHVDIVSINGTVVYSERMDKRLNEDLDVDISGLARGVYVVRLVKDNEVFTAKFVR